MNAYDEAQIRYARAQKALEYDRQQENEARVALARAIAQTKRAKERTDEAFQAVEKAFVSCGLMAKVGY